MNFLDIPVIMVIAALTFFVSTALSKKIKVAEQILFLVVGVIFGLVLKALNYEQITDVLPSIERYNGILLSLMFFAAGFSINIKSIKESGKTTVKLFTIPSYVETLVTTIVLFVLVKFLGGAIGVELSIAQVLVITGCLALASPAIGVPVCLKLLGEGYKGKNNMPTTMLAVSIIDSFSTIPLILIGVVMTIAEQSGGSASILMLVGILFGVIIGVILLVGLGILLGWIVITIFSPLMKKLAAQPENKGLGILTLVLVYGVSVTMTTLLSSLPTVGQAFSAFGVLIICAMGGAVKHFDKSGAAPIVSKYGNIVFAIFGLPAMFIFVGSRMDLASLASVNMLVIGITVTVVAVVTKWFTTKKVLDDTYTEGEKKFAAAIFVPKGITLVNFGLVLMPILGKLGLTPMIDFMFMLAAISIVISISYGITLLNGAKGKWIDKVE